MNQPVCAVPQAPQHERLRVSHLDIAYRRVDGSLRPAVSDACFSLAQGQSLGIVGESGSGKSTLARALLGYTRPGGVITGGSVRIDGQEVCGLSSEGLRALRGGRVAFVPQNPLSSLTPHLRVGAQVAEAVRIHQRCDAATARQVTLELFAATHLPDQQDMYGRFPHELSGGQRQRVVIAAALAGNPGLVVLDEPTTALDKTTEIQVLELVQQLRRRLNATLVYVSHDLNVISEMCDRVLVMLDGCIVEEGPTRQVYRAAQHEYTRRLIASIPRLDRPVVAEPCDPVSASAFVSASATAIVRSSAAASVSASASVSVLVATAPAAPLLAVERLSFSYPQRRSWLRRAAPASRPALHDLSFEIAPGETLGLVGESGSGKSTAAAIVAGLLAPGGGGIRFAGQALAGLAAQRNAEQRRRIQIIFQDPLSSLNPRQRVAEILMRPLALFRGLHGARARDEAQALMQRLQLDPTLLDCYPRQLSGGQQQRVAIARAFAAEPDLIICDEVTSALDVSVQAQVLKLLAELQRQSGVACLFISHDLGVIRQIAGRVVVLHGGEVREAGDTAAVFAQPADRYTRELISAATRGYGNLPDALAGPALVVNSA
ncbi:MAG: ABC transporter ATP-binding protein [Burkholderiales bacterium]|nr:ABC transporter ATP-binding protein [Burkholderiales bacterium]